MANNKLPMEAAVILMEVAVEDQLANGDDLAMVWWSGGQLT